MKNQLATKSQQGFTIIELITVIVILGILAAVAVPRFVDLGTAAREASVNSIASSLTSASTLNHANNIADDAGLTTTTPITAVTRCEHVVNLLEGGAIPTGYVVQTANIPGPEGSSRSDCTVAFDSNGNGTLNGGDTPRADFTAYDVVP